MRANYHDIRRRIQGDPLWHDENGCPRYDPFHPSMVADIYASEVALLEIGCQGCLWRGLVAMSYVPWYSLTAKSLGTAIKQQIIHYGDPPWHEDENGETCIGGTMNCGDFRVVEFWAHHPAADWQRDHAYEIVLHDPDAREGDDA